MIRTLKYCFAGFALGVAALSAAHAQACGESEDPESCEPSAGEVPYLHPLKDTALPDGRVPLVDVKDDPSGRRYALVDELEELPGGQVNRRSRLVTLKRSRPNARQRRQLELQKANDNGGVPNRSDDPPQVIGDRLAGILAEVPPSQPVAIMARFEFEAEPLIHAMDRAIGQGEVQTVADFQRARLARLGARAQQIDAVRRDILGQVAELGGKLTYRCRNMPCFNAEVPAGAVHQLADHPLIRKLDADARGEDEAKGDEVAKGHQIWQFFDAGYDGENSGASHDITAAIIESTEVHDNHDALLDCDTCDDRIRQIYDCTSSSCSTAVFTNPGSHSCGVHAIAVGDLTDDQDPSETGTLRQKNRSGVSREGRFYSYATDFDTANKREALDHVISRSVMPHAVNMSWGDSGDDDECKGKTNLNEDANDLFENGLLLVKSAGNNGTGTGAGDCTISSPGSAIGVFTVASMGETSTDNDVRNSNISSFSSRGGTSSEGSDRSIVDVTAFGCRTLLMDTTGGYSYSGCGTSFAAPVVTGAMMNYVDAYKHEVSDLIDEPGVRYASLLLSGDRHSASGDKTSRYVNRYGAGRLQMRMPGSAGMDAPNASGWGYTCVDDGERVTLSINGGNALDSDVDDFKAVIYWFDPRHENGRSVSDVDLYLKTTGGSTLRSSTDAFDNKERVFKSGVGGDAVKLEIYGYDVKTDTVGCGNNSMKVYYAWFYEDDDRDDANGPDSNVLPE